MDLDLFINELFISSAFFDFCKRRAVKYESARKKKGLNRCQLPPVTGS
jgi:hypothetical protein